MSHSRFLNVNYLCFLEFHGMKGQGYCQGGFSADFTKVSSLNPLNMFFFPQVFFFKLAFKLQGGKVVLGGPGSYFWQGKSNRYTEYSINKFMVLFQIKQLLKNLIWTSVFFLRTAYLCCKRGNYQGLLPRLFSYISGRPDSDQAEKRNQLWWQLYG